jgi:hypothetical protein
MMRRTSWLVVPGLCAATMLLVACASSLTATRPTPPPGATGSPTARSSPANSPLTACIDPKPSQPKPVDTVVAKDFADDRLQTELDLDDGGFQATPAPSGAQPRVSASIALCNLLAGGTAGNFTVLDAVAEHGMSFGLAVVTVADSVLKTGPGGNSVGRSPPGEGPQSYRARLAWIAVIKPDVISSCPSSPSPPNTQKRIPPYQILAIDADTGAAGILYSAKTNALCGFPGYRAAYVTVAAEFVSVPWTLVSRGPGPQSATIRYEPRSCDQRDLGTFGDTGKPVVLADRDDPGLIRVSLVRNLTECGPPVPTDILLRSSTLATDLPQRLVAAPVGAEDVSN